MQPEVHLPRIRYGSKQTDGAGCLFLERRTRSRLRAKRRHPSLQIRKREKSNGGAEKGLFSSIVIACQQRVQDFLLFGKLGLERGNSHVSGPRKVLEHVPVGQEGIEARGLPEPNTRKFGAGEAIFHFAMLPAAPDDGAELVSLPAAAARAIAAKVHGTEKAAKAAEGKGGILPPIVFH